MKLVSWNVNGLRSVEGKGRLGEFLVAHEPDVVCLQEIKMDAGQAGFFEDKYAEWRQFYGFARKKGYAGTAIWVRKDLEDVNERDDRAAELSTKSVQTGEVLNVQFDEDLTDQFGDLQDEGRVVAVEFDGFYLVNVYSPHTKRELERLPIKEKWNAAVLRKVKELERVKPVVLCGDLNVAHREIDLANPKANEFNAGFTKEERADFDRFMEAGLVDTFRLKNGDVTGAYTWWTWRANARARNIGWRIDYFLVSEILAGRVEGAEVLSEVMGSDHCPVSLTLS